MLSWRMSFGRPLTFIARFLALEVRASSFFRSAPCRPQPCLELRKGTQPSRFLTNANIMNTYKHFGRKSRRMNTCDLRDLKYLQNEHMQKRRGRGHMVMW